MYIDFCSIYFRLNAVLPEKFSQTDLVLVFSKVFVRTAAELLGRQIILYPVIPHQNDRHRVIISPSIQSIHEPFHIIYYEETNFVNPHYQSIRPRQTPILAAAPNNGNRGHGPSQQSLLSRLSAMNSTNHDQGMWIFTLVID